jgi:hypothetical protein
LPNIDQTTTESGDYIRKSVSCSGSAFVSSSELYFRVDKLLNQLATPNLHDIPSNLQIHVDLWDRYNKHIR